MNNNSFIIKIKRYIIEKNMIQAGDRVICALSGGADSVCMTYVLNILAKDMGFHITAAHLNHCLRGAEANADEEFARSFCKKHEIPFYSKRIDIKHLAEMKKIGEEEAGRVARYAFFEEIKSETGAEKIATAHNKNDNAETVMHHIIRGSGIAGITGIPPVRDDIIRPMLRVTRLEIEAFCAQCGLNYVTDSTNLTKKYTRNRIRLELFPLICETFNTDITDKLVALSEAAACENDYIKSETEKFLNKYIICGHGRAETDVKSLEKLHAALRNRIIIKMAEQAGGMLEYKHILLINDFIKTAETGKKLNMPGVCVRISYGRLIFEKEASADAYEITAYDGMNVTVNGYTLQCGCGGVKIPEGTVIRNRRNGDKITVNGMTKKVKKIFIDKKIPTDLRDRIPLAEYGGEILLIGGIAEADALNKYNESKLELNIIEPSGQ